MLTVTWLKFVIKRNNSALFGASTKISFVVKLLYIYIKLPLHEWLIRDNSDSHIHTEIRRTRGTRGVLIAVLN